MNTTSARAARRRSLVALAALATVVVPASGAEAATSVGRFTTLAAGTGLGLEIDGVALLSRTANGTRGRVVVLGLEPGVTYAAHLHNQPCGDANPGGGHYMNVTGAGAAPPNEVWFSSSSASAASRPSTAVEPTCSMAVTRSPRARRTTST